MLDWHLDIHEDDIRAFALFTVGSFTHNLASRLWVKHSV